MSTPSYDTSRYDSASNKYKQLLETYTGESGMRKATDEASLSASQSAKSAGASAVANYLAAGYSRAKAAELAQKDAVNAYNSTYGTAYSNASNMNNAKVNGYNSLLNNELNIDDKLYANNVTKNNATLSAIGGALQGAASALGGNAGSGSAKSSS